MFLLLALLACGTDEDGDGFTVVDDCNDGDPLIYPGAPEICDGWDNDCDGRFDVDAVDASTFYTDADGDGFGDADAPLLQCSLRAGAVSDDSDCDDSRADRYPGAPEDCSATADLNCDGSMGQEDQDASVFPGASEDCDGVDDDCDGVIDEGACDYTHADMQAIWEAACTTRCHAAPGASADLDLEIDAYGAMVNVRSGQSPLDFIVPGDLERSYLVHKLRGTQSTVSGSGTRMPKTGTLDPADLAKIEAWIIDGAAP